MGRKRFGARLARRPARSATEPDRSLVQPARSKAEPDYSLLENTSPKINRYKTRAVHTL